MSDERLLEAWRGGDAAAGQELFRRHFDAVYWFFRNKIDTGADDLAQQTFLDLVRNRDAVGSRHSFRAYLFAVARSNLIDALRDRAPDRIIDPMQSSVLDLGGSSSSIIDSRRAQAKLLSALRRIPFELQTIVELRYFEQLTVRELAEVLDISEDTVRSRLKRALGLLRESLGSSDPFADPSDDELN